MRKTLLGLVAAATLFGGLATAAAEAKVSIYFGSAILQLSARAGLSLLSESRLVSKSAVLQSGKAHCPQSRLSQRLGH